MRVIEAWIQGFTGEGVTVGVVDDGKSKHPRACGIHGIQCYYSCTQYHLDPMLLTLLNSLISFRATAYTSGFVC